MSLHFKKVAIVGVGLIGGSLGMVLRQHRLADEIVGIGRRVENLQTAVQVGAIHRYVTRPQEGIEGADLVVLATPVASYEIQLEAWGGYLQPGTILTDVGSVKGHLVEQVERALPNGVLFVGAHPIAGKEKTGAMAGSADLFTGARCIITPTQRSHESAIKSVREIWEATGARVLFMDPHVHDRVFGAVSHLPHVAAFSLMTVLDEIEKLLISDIDLLSFSGGGLRDTTRIAGSSPEMWRDICLANRDNLVRMIEMYQAHLAHFRKLIQDGDAAALEKEMERSRQLRNRMS